MNSSGQPQGIEILNKPQQTIELRNENEKLREQNKMLERRWTETEKRMKDLEALLPAKVSCAGTEKLLTEQVGKEEDGIRGDSEV